MVTVVGMIELYVTKLLVLFVIVVVLVVVVVMVIAVVVPEDSDDDDDVVTHASRCLCLFLRPPQVQATIQRREWDCA